MGGCATHGSAGFADDAISGYERNYIGRIFSSQHHRQGHGSRLCVGTCFAGRNGLLCKASIDANLPGNKPIAFDTLPCSRATAALTDRINLTRERSFTKLSPDDDEACPQGAEASGFAGESSNYQNKARPFNDRRDRVNILRRDRHHVLCAA